MSNTEIMAALDAIFDAFGPVQPAYRPGEAPHGYRWADQWRAEPVGRCVRCRDRSHTPGPDGRPWHPFCWMVPTLPVPRRR